jgi:predicted XRE-type DNA-binding protein
MSMKTTTRSSGNVFADAGIPNAAEHELKARVVMIIADEIKNQALDQKEAAAMMGFTQPDVSRILRGNFSGYSLARLLRMAQGLGRDVEIRIPARSDRTSHRPGRLSLHC